MLCHVKQTDGKSEVHLVLSQVEALDVFTTLNVGIASAANIPPELAAWAIGVASDEQLAKAFPDTKRGDLVLLKSLRQVLKHCMTDADKVALVESLKP